MHAIPAKSHCLAIMTASIQKVSGLQRMQYPLHRPLSHSLWTKQASIARGSLSAMPWTHTPESVGGIRQRHVLEAEWHIYRVDARSKDDEVARRRLLGIRSVMNRCPVAVRAVDHFVPLRLRQSTLKKATIRIHKRRQLLDPGCRRLIRHNQVRHLDLDDDARALHACGDHFECAAVDR